MKLLFVEDDLRIRNNLRLYLKSIFSQVIETADGQTAFELYNKLKPDIILLDINIPKMNGIQFATKIREKDSRTIIIVLTAYDDRDILLKAVELKLKKYLLKPVSRHVLKEVLNSSIQDLKDLDYVHLIDKYKWNIKNKTLSYKNLNIKLTKHEIKLLNTYCTNSKYMFTSEDISSTIYPEDGYNDNKIRMFLKRFRKNTSPNLLRNIYGMGYKFNYA